MRHLCPILSSCVVWVDQKESFMCHLNECESSASSEPNGKKNSTSYDCAKVACECVPDRMLCGADGSVDISDFLTIEIHGPATFECSQERGGDKQCFFSEPAMNDLISSIFADSNIQLSCQAGECLYHTQVPGYAPQVPKINTPLIAGVIAGCSLFLVAVILLTWYLSRREVQIWTHPP